MKEYSPDPFNFFFCQSVSWHAGQVYSKSRPPTESGHQTSKHMSINNKHLNNLHNSSFTFKQETEIVIQELKTSATNIIKAASKMAPSEYTLILYTEICHDL